MEFRPCIDIHNGKVKQIVGGSLKDEGESAAENFVSGQDAAYFARLYRERGISGGHVIMLNAAGSEHYGATRAQALEALRAYPNGLQVGGGITAENAAEYLDAGASHVIVTSYVFQKGRIRYDRLSALRSAVGRERLVLDLSCRRRGDAYFVVTDRWQNFTDERVEPGLLDLLSGYCDEFLIHAVDVEGRSGGIEPDLAEMLGGWDGIPVTYAGGVGSFDDIRLLRQLGRGRLNVTIGSALDIFGGPMAFEEVLAFMAG